MKITFPHMGNMHIAIKALFKELKIETIPPPPVSQRTLELGVKYSPEFACLPLKVNVGNFIEAMEIGADTILMAGGWGPCRFGYYAQIERDILNDLGFSFDMIILEAPESRVTDLLNQLRLIGENVSIWQMVKAVNYTWHKLKAIDYWEKCYERYLGPALDKQAVNDLYNQGLQQIDEADTKQKVTRTLQELETQIKQIPQHNKPVLNIGLIGEVYTILEPATNYNIIRQLGELNVTISRSIYMSDWVNDHLLKGMVIKSNHKHIVNCAEPYLNYWVGGHGQETIGYAVDFARQKYDGLIQIGPLTCMPEIVAQSILGKVSIEQGIPCMTLYFDEHSGTAGISTRLEAFVDMLGRKQVGQQIISEGGF